jgi:hypothetical protein
MGRPKKEIMGPMPAPASIGAMWKRYNVTMKIRDRLYGGIPKDPAQLSGFLIGKGVASELVEQRAALVATQIDSKVPEDAPEGEELKKAWTCFKKDEMGLYVETRQVKALLRECSSASELIKKVYGVKSRIGDQIFPVGEGGADKIKIYLYKDGKIVKEPDGYEQNPARIRGAKGEQSIIKIKDYVESPTISFTLKVGGNTITEDMLRYMFEYGTEIGFGADRACEKGKYDYTLEAISEPQTKPE